ncbi:MAG: hypothetical protein JST45_05475 [Bacteroidetes bacterium]|nr:hypothetical protein [Bacteroidota bacterium]
MHNAPTVASSVDLVPIILFFHSLLRWGILLTVAVAGFAALLGWLRNGPVITWQRAVAIWAMILCHVQLVLGFVLYGMDINKGVFAHMASDYKRYWKFEHMGMMLVVIALVTIGRLSSKKAKTENGKHLRVAVFYLLALVLMLAMIPWPFTRMGDGRGWL